MEQLSTRERLFRLVAEYEEDCLAYCKLQRDNPTASVYDKDWPLCSIKDEQDERERRLKEYQGMLCCLAAMGRYRGSTVLRFWPEGGEQEADPHDAQAAPAKARKLYPYGP